MKTRSLLTLLLIAGASASARSATTPASAERIKADVTRLASPAWEGRRAGTRGADAAADWIGAEFQRIGLKPGAADGSYFQSFTFVDGVVVGPDNRLALALEPPTRWRMDEDFRPLAFSAAGRVSGDVVFAGYGIVAPDLGYDDFAGLDVKDKVVLVLRYGPDGDDPHSKWSAFMPLRLKVSNARDRGARAVLVATGPRPAGAKDELVALRGDAALADAGIPAFSVRRAVAEALMSGSGTTLEEAQKTIDEGGKPASRALRWPVDGMADVAPKRSATRNVIGLLPGAAGTQETIVIGAHYDHLGLGGMSASLDPSPEGKVHAGADDNASGVSGLLELARRLSTQPRRRAILFAAFGAEEEGTLGSSHFVKEPPVPLTSVVAMLNMDMVGRLREDTLAVHGTGTSTLWPGLMEKANAGVGLKLKHSEGGYGPSDHSPFYAAGRPVLFFFTGAHEDYHKSSDTADRVNAEGIARVADLAEGIVSRLAASEEPVPFTRVAAEKETATATRGFRVWVGGIPDYGAEGPGVRFTGVTAGSPAERAGLQAGDVLVRFGAKEVRNVYDYTYALAERKAGDKVTVVVKRGGAEVSLDVVLGSRPSANR
jgi:aminopeptidase YwaD